MKDKKGYLDCKFSLSVVTDRRDSSINRLSLSGTIDEISKEKINLVN